MKRQLVVRTLGIVTGLMLAGMARAQMLRPPSSGQPAAASSATPVPTLPAAGPTVPAPVKSQWEQWVEDYYKIVRVPKGSEDRVDAKHAYPSKMIPALMEIVEEDGQFVYLRNLPLEDPRSAGHKTWAARQGFEAREVIQQEFLKDKFLLENQEFDVPAPFTDRIQFEERGAGLPFQGLWQMGFDVGDFDGDGRLDLVLPPARKGAPNPWIILNKPDGWKIWKEAKWPDIPFDYGDVKVADFDGDGNLDIAIANHFKRAYVMYGNGKGDFTRYVELPNANSYVTSRAIAVADFNHDGRPDVVQLAELDLNQATSTQISSGLVTVDLNTPDGWKLSPATFPENIYGDKVTVGDFNGDAAPDILISSHKSNNESYLFVNSGDGTRFAPVGGDAFPWRAFVFGVATGSLDREKPEQAILAVVQTVRPEPGEYYTVHAILAYRIAGRDGRLLPKPERRVLYRDQAGDLAQFRCLAVGDLDGDGRPDIVVGRATGGLLVLMQMPDGSFAEERSPELNVGDASPNHVMIRDLDGDGHVELIAAFSDGKKTTPGSVKVWRVVRKAGVKGAEAAKK